MPAAEVDVVPLSPSLAAAHVDFARRAFGPRSYQARANYLRWLYDEAPSTQWGDARVAVSQNRIVGCFHAMVLPWTLPSIEPVLAPQSLFVDETFRTGVGLALIAETLRRRAHVLLLGAGPSVRPIYERLGAQRVTTHWFATLINPLTAPIVAAGQWFSPNALSTVLDLACKLIGKTARRFEVYDAPSEQLLGNMADVLGQRDATASRVSWTPRLLRWRFFARRGPRHIVATYGDAIAIVSVGTHHSLSVARIVEWRASNSRHASLLLVGLRIALAAIGINALLAMTTDDTTALQWRYGGFWRVRNPPAVFQLHRPVTSISYRPISIYGGAGDVGFEAFRTQ